MIILTCRPGFEEALREALLRRVRGRGGGDPVQRCEAGAAWLAVAMDAAQWAAAGVEEPLVFERQRIPDARWFAGTDVETHTDAIGADLLPALSGAAWVLHAFTPRPGAGDATAGRAVTLGRGLAEKCARAYPAVAPHLVGIDEPAPPGAQVLQVCVVADGVWAAVTPAGALSDPFPGGAHRMHDDPAAPSRSYLKLEEALDVMGWAPRPRERVVDLGAAPGGWSYAMLKRGCRVLAVDNGPLKLADPDALPGELTHVRSDGLRFRPPPGWLPVDWLLADMLVPPGVALGLLRKWVEGGWCRRLVVNVKIPQKNPLPTLAPLLDWLQGSRAADARVRQLYHDRREVTVMGTVTAPARPASRSSAGPRGRGGGRKGRPARKGHKP